MTCKKEFKRLKKSLLKNHNCRVLGMGTNISLLWNQIIVENIRKYFHIKVYLNGLYCSSHHTIYKSLSESFSIKPKHIIYINKFNRHEKENDYALGLVTLWHESIHLLQWVDKGKCDEYEAQEYALQMSKDFLNKYGIEEPYLWSIENIVWGLKNGDDKRKRVAKMLWEKI